jgi:leader peptidase (prepilin peptidase)/N-methyltransferase
MSTSDLSARLRPDADTRNALRRWAVPVAAATVLLGAAVAYRSGPTAALPALLLFTAMGAVLGAVDTALHRLPDSITVPGTLLLLVLLAYPATQDPAAAARALACAGIMFVLYWLARLFGTAGAGDVKASVSVGLVTGWAGWSVAAAAFVLGWFLLGTGSIVLLATRRARLTSRVAMGAAMYGGAVLALLVAGPQN